MLDFPVHPRLKEDEELRLQQLVEREPIISRTTFATLLLLLGLDIVEQSEDGFQRLLQILRRRRLQAGAMA